MQFEKLEDITPWKDDQYLSFINHTDEKENNLMESKKKYSLVLEQKYPKKLLFTKRNTEVSASKKIKLAKYDEEQNEQMAIKTSKLKTLFDQQRIKKTNRLLIVEFEKANTMGVPSSDLIIKRYNRIKKYQKYYSKQFKFTDIFKKINQIQNPMQRQGIYLPKIQLKI